MKINRQLLEDAAGRGLLQAAQVQPLWQFLEASESETPSFKAAHILYYLGGLIAIGAMSLFMNLGWEQFGGEGLLIIASFYCLLAVGLTEWFLGRKVLAIPAGITAALAVVMVPLAIYGAQLMLGFWPEDEGGGDLAYRDYHRIIDWRWIFMEGMTLIAGAIVLWRYRLPFAMLPVAVTLWYLSMDLTPFLLGEHFEYWSDEGKWVSVIFGLAMMFVALWVDLRSRSTKDFAFWLYIFGVLTFWGGLTSMDSDSELNKFIYCCINLAMIAVGAALSRRVFAVFGGLGVAFYLGHLSDTVFKDSLLFPVALTAIGLGVIAAGVFWQRHEARIGEALRSFLPEPVQQALARRR